MATTETGPALSAWRAWVSIAQRKHEANGPDGRPKPSVTGEHPRNRAFTWAFVERVTRIELALSAWEAERLRLIRALTCQPQVSALAVVDPSSPWLMAR